LWYKPGKGDDAPMNLAALVCAAVVAVAPVHPSLHPQGKEVACTDASKRVTGRNALGMPLWWYQLNATWCWDRHMVITRGSNWTTEDTPALCWEYDGDRHYHQDGGKGHSSWDVSRQGAFHCTLGPMTSRRYPTVGLHLEGGGASE